MKRSPILNPAGDAWPDPLTVGNIRFITAEEPDSDAILVSERALITVCHHRARKFTVYANYSSWNEIIGTYETRHHTTNDPINVLKGDFKHEDIPLAEHEWIRVHGWMLEQFYYSERRRS